MGDKRTSSLEAGRGRERCWLKDVLGRKDRGGAGIHRKGFDSSSAIVFLAEKRKAEDESKP